MCDPDLSDAIAAKQIRLNQLILESQPVVVTNLTQLLIAYSTIPQFWQGANDTEKKVLYRDFIKRIDVDGDSIEIKLKV